MTSNELLVQSSVQTVQTKTTPKVASSDGSAITKAPVITQEQAEPESGVPKAEAPLQEQQQAELQEKVAELNDYVQHLNRSLQFSVDEQSGQTVVRVVDAETKELVRQIPSQEVLNARNAAENYRGLLLEAKV